MTAPSAPAYDLAVVGGGPAGSSCALTAARAGAGRILLLEAARQRPDKPCGEGIMPSGVAVLEALGLPGLVRSGRPFPGIRYRLPGHRSLDLDLPRPGLALWRPDLQAALDAAVAAEKAIEVWRTPVRVARAAGGYRLRSGGREVQARLLAVADGALGRTAPWLREPARRPLRPGRLGLRARFREAQPLDRVEVHLGPGVEVYLTPLPRRTVNVAVLLDERLPGGGGSAALLELALDRLPAARECLGELVTPPAARRLDAPRPRRAADASSFLLGDALGAVDPILGCGVAIALATGHLAGRHGAALLQGADPVATARRYARATRRETRARQHLAGLLLACARSPRLAGAALGLARSAPVLARPLVAVAAGTLSIS